MPVRDGSAFLADAISSILAQTFAEFELLIIDDSSGPSARDILERSAAADPRISLVPCPGNGIVDALNQGLALARAPLVARMDGDDISYPDRLAKQLAYLEARPSTAVAGANYDVINKVGAFVETVSLPISSERIRANLTHRNCIAHPTVIMRKDAIASVGGYRHSFAQCEDFDLWVRVAEHYNIENMPDVVLRYRRHEKQATWSALEQRLISEVAIFESAAMRAKSGNDLALGSAPVSIELLQTCGIPAQRLRRAVRERALFAAIDAINGRQFGQARTALEIARRYGVLGSALLGQYWKLRAKSALLSSDLI